METRAIFTLIGLLGGVIYLLGRKKRWAIYALIVSFGGFVMSLIFWIFGGSG